MEIISSIMAILVVIILAFQQVRSGSSALTKRIIEDYKIRLDQQDKKIKDLENSDHDRQIEIARLQATLSEKEKQLTEYKEIFQNRNPELVDILKDIKEFMQKIHMQNAHQTELLEKRSKRDQEVDEASKHRVGAPMMAPVSPDNHK